MTVDAPPPRPRVGRLIRFFAHAVAFSILLAAASDASAADFSEWAPTPPMGWNSWDCYGASVTEEEVKANAAYMAEKLLPYGWQYVVVDIRWTVQNPARRPYNQDDPRFTLDDHGRFVPAPNRFPSSRDGAGFKPLADHVHSLGLKFGLHIMRGVPRAAVDPERGAPEGGYPIAGSEFTTADIQKADNGAVWLRDMYGMRKTDAAQAYYDSLFKLYASWEVDYVKVDDLNNPYARPGEPNYYGDEIEMLRTAIDRCGRPIVLSTSPGPHPLKNAEHISRHANLWRVSNDFWDRWDALERQFEQLHRWTPYRSAGHWPDGDMLPLGRLAIRGERGGERSSHLTRDEQMTLMTLWSIARSPLMFGGDLPSNDEWTLSLITNPEVLTANQEGRTPKQASRSRGRVVWTSDAPASVGEGGKYLAVFNLTNGRARDNAFEPFVGLSSLDIEGPVRVRDLWRREDLGRAEGELRIGVEPHGARMVLLTPERSDE